MAEKVTLKELRFTSNKKKTNDWLYHPNGKDFLIEGNEENTTKLLNNLKDELVYYISAEKPVCETIITFIQTKRRIRLDLESYSMNSYPYSKCFSDDLVDYIKEWDYGTGERNKIIKEFGQMEKRLSFMPGWEALEDMSKDELQKFTPYLPGIVEYFWDAARDTNSAIGSDEESINSEYVPTFKNK